MSNFGKPQETGEGSVKKIYTGVENFKVLSINPNHDQLKALYGENAKEDTYVSKSELKDADGNVIGEVAQVKFVLHLDNNNEELPIKTRLTFFVNKQEFKSAEKGTTQMINMYGRTAWLNDEQIAQALPEYQLPKKEGGTFPFNGEGMRKAYRGEAELISTLRVLLGLKNPDKVTNKADAASQFSIQDWEAFFSGNFSMLQGIVNNAPNKIGVLLGAKKVEDNVYQDVFNRLVVASYVKNSQKFDYLRSQVQNSQNNGAYSFTDFGDPSYKLVEYAPDASPSTPSVAATSSVPGFTATTFDPSAAGAFSGK